MSYSKSDGSSVWGADERPERIGAAGTALSVTSRGGGGFTKNTPWLMMLVALWETGELAAPRRQKYFAGYTKRSATNINSRCCICFSRFG